MVQQAIERHTVARLAFYIREANKLLDANRVRYTKFLNRCEPGRWRACWVVGASVFTRHAIQTDASSFSQALLTRDCLSQQGRTAWVEAVTT